MAMEPENLVLAMLREIRAKQDDHSVLLIDLQDRMTRLETQHDDHVQVVIHALGQSTETKFKQSRQEGRLNELFDKVEKLLLDKQPT